MSQQFLFDLPAPAPSVAWDPMTDMWGQPSACSECGGPYERQGAYLTCASGHWRFIEAFCSPNGHPMREVFVRYRRSIGHPVED